MRLPEKCLKQGSQTRGPRDAFWPAKVVYAARVPQKTITHEDFYWKEGIFMVFLAQMYLMKPYKWRNRVTFDPWEPPSKNCGPQSHISFNVGPTEHLW